MSRILCDCMSRCMIHRSRRLDFQWQYIHSIDGQDLCPGFSFQAEVMKCYQIYRIERPTAEYTNELKFNQMFDKIIFRIY